MDADQLIALGREQAAGDWRMHPDEIPWIPQADGVWFRPLRISPELGTWTNLLRVTRKGRVSLHRHLGPVEAWVLTGQWRYEEHDWIARPGDYVYEPAGDVHTLTTDTGDDSGEMITLFSIGGPYEFIGPDGEVTAVESAEVKLRRYVEYCAAHGIAVAPIIT